MQGYAHNTVGNIGHGRENAPVSSSTSSSILRVRELKKQHGERMVLDGINFSLRAGESIAVLGASGCGKTSLLYLLCGLAMPSAGEVLFAERPLRAPCRDIALIMQDYGLLPWRTVLENVALGLKIRGMDKAKRVALAKEALANVGLLERADDFPALLSGGEKQRVAIARAFAQSPMLLLMDEPFSSLDAMTREALQDTVLAAWQRVQVPFVLVTHSVEEAVYLGQRIVLLGKTESEGAKVRAVFDNPCFSRALESAACRHAVGANNACSNVTDANSADANYASTCTNVRADKEFFAMTARVRAELELWR